MANLTDQTVNAVVDVVLARASVDPEKREAVSAAARAALDGLGGGPEAISRAAPRAVRSAVVANNPELAPFGPVIQLAVENVLDPDTVRLGLRTTLGALRRLARAATSWLPWR